MHKLHIGSLGTLGVMAEATFKVAPLPRVDQTVAVAAPSARAACALARRFGGAGLALQAAEVLSPPAAYAVLGHGGWSLLIRAAGGAGAVTRTLAEITAGARDAGGGVEEVEATTWDAWIDAFAHAPLSLRVSVPATSGADAMTALDRRFVGAAGRLSATVSAGVIRAALDPTFERRAPALLRQAQDVAQHLGGSVVVDAAPISLKRDIDVFGELRPDFPIMQRLKQEFDPARVLAPGRFVGRL
jgi:glycolate oxidase FAD binding subunit